MSPLAGQSPEDMGSQAEQGNQEMRIFTIGHSNLSFEEFLSVLRIHAIEAIADIRSFPSSKKFPHFNRQNLEDEFPKYGIEYQWVPKLGGMRKAVKGYESPNAGLTSPGFRAYADYMTTEEFLRGVEELLSVARKMRTAYMCAEALYWRCHRKLLSDYLAAKGFEVFHVVGRQTLVAHEMTEEAIMTPEGVLIYPSPNIA
jgi:uncharacterized protein (DUF488 family)